MKIKSAKTILRIATLLTLSALLLGGCQGATPTPLPATATMTAQPAATVAVSGEDPIRITKYAENYTAFKIEIQGGATIITDPYIMDEQVHADIVTESHQHGDHTDVSHILEPYELLNKPGVFDVAGVKITGIAGAHNKITDTNSYNFLLDNGNIIYVFDLGGIRLAQFASQGQMPTPEMFAEIGKVDVLIIQIFRAVPHKMDMSEASRITAALSARIIIPAHGDQSLNEEFSQLIGADFRPEPSGVLDLSRSDLDQIKTPIVLVLDH